MWRAVGIALVLTAVSGCSTGSMPLMSPQEILRLQAAPPEVYRIEPGDTLAIHYTYHPEMKQEETVRYDGKIVATLVGEVAVAGLTPSQVERLLIERTSELLRKPEVRVEILRLRERNVYVSGEVGKPGLVPYTLDLTALQAIVTAGGFRDTARMDHVVLVRTDASGRNVLSRKLDLKRVILDGEPEPVSLAPRDVLFVPRTPIADADVWVRQHITELIPFLRVPVVPW